MIKGMTGYGSAVLNSFETKGIVEVKSLNGRYLDISYYLPIGYGSLEDKIRRLCLKYLERGRLSVSLKITHKKAEEVFLNKDVVESYLKHAKSLKRDYKLKSDLSLSDIFKLQGVFETKESVMSPDKLWPYLEKCLKQALKDLVAMRAREGQSLARDIREKLDSMSGQIKLIQIRAKAVLREVRKKLNDEEFQSYQRGNDINEELTRLKHYIGEIKPLMSKGSSAGKRIDFIAQEMQRETNTIGAKLQDKNVSNAVITLKSKIEKIREQAQNIE